MQPVDPEINAPEIPNEVWELIYRKLSEYRAYFETTSFDQQRRDKENGVRWSLPNNRVFVYGTLMTGQPANHYLSSGICLGRYTLQDYAMYHLGAYPGIVQQPGESVVGEVYEIPESLWAQMDEYECEGSLYHRRFVVVERNNEPLTVQAYIYARSVEGYPLMRQPWNQSTA